MSLPIVPELSLYQLTQQHDPPPTPLGVRTVTFQGLIKATLTLLRENQLSATLWVKLPTTAQWLGMIESYHRQGLAEQIYLCQMHKRTAATPTEKGTVTDSLVKLGFTPLLLEASIPLKREYFLAVLSPEFCTLILANKSTPHQATDKNLQPFPLQLIHSFSPSLIEKVVIAIKQALIITDTTPENLLTDEGISSQLPDSPSADLLSRFLQDYLQQTENVNRSKVINDELAESAGQKSDVLTFNETLVQELSREMSIPLTNMKTALRLLDSLQHKREQRKRYIDLLQRECDRQNALITGLQELIESKSSPSESTSSVKLEEFVPGIVSTYQPLAEEKGIVLGYTIAPGLPPVACSNQGLRQILRQLLHNSLKFTPARGRVQVVANLNNEWVSLTITDTGVGIDHSDQSKIYNLFYRGRNANTPETMGAGLGLTIVKQLLDSYGGAIAVSSQPNRGTTFTLTLPIASFNEDILE